MKWDLETSGVFTVKYIYAKLIQCPRMRYAKALWASRVPLKACIFLWQASLDCLPSACNLHKRSGPGNDRCALCGNPKNVDHILFRYAPAKFLWSHVRESFGAPNSLVDQLALIRSSRGQHCRLAWRCISLGALDHPQKNWH